nr:MAG TPA: hypothetical protein [Caudoviricetes sp.]
MTMDMSLDILRIPNSLSFIKLISPKHLKFIEALL